MTSDQFVFNTTGTLGDQLPVLGTARELQRRGAWCHVLGTEAALPFAQRLGIPFTAVAPTCRNNLVSLEENFGKNVFPSFGPTQQYIEGELRRGSRLAIVNLSAITASTLLAERHGLPLFRLELTPFRLPSLQAPPWPWSEGLNGPGAEEYRRVTLPNRYLQWYRHPFIVEQLNLFRRTLGMNPVSSTLSLQRLIRHRIAFFPEWFAPAPEDWPKNMDFAGFPLPDHGLPLPERLREWLETHPRPLVFTPGTGVVSVREFFEVARETCKRTGRTGVFLSPHVTSEIVSKHPQMIHFPHVALERLLPFAGLLVHHGGIGTTARALQAGIPQVISAQAFDQPDNGHRIERLGVGAALAREELTVDALAALAESLLRSDLVRSRLQRVARRMRSEDALAAAANILLHHVSESPAGRPRDDTVGDPQLENPNDFAFGSGRST